MTRRRVLLDLEALARCSPLGQKSTKPISFEPAVKAEFTEKIAKGQGPVKAEANLVEEFERFRKKKRETGKDPVVTLDEEEAEEEEEFAVEKWESPLLHNGRPINNNDRVARSSELAFDITKSLLLPLDMAQHNENATVQMLKGTVQMLSMGIQRLHLAMDRVSIVECNLAEATSIIEQPTQAVDHYKSMAKVAERSAAKAKASVAITEKAKEEMSAVLEQREAEVAEFEGKRKE